MNVHLAGGMRMQDDEVLMGIFDLTDESFEPRVEALLSELRKRINACDDESDFDINFSSDVLVATT